MQQLANWISGEGGGGKNAPWEFSRSNFEHFEAQQKTKKIMICGNSCREL